MGSFFENEDDFLAFEECLNGLDDEEYVRFVGRALKAALDQLDNEDFVVNKPQFAKLLASYAFFKELSKQQNIRVNLDGFEPKMMSGGLEVDGLVIDFSGEELQKFCQVTSYASCVSIDSNVDGEACLSIVIPDVFRHKDE